jgi:hypothetical protein
MMWLDGALKGISILSTAIATLRAGSRFVYLVEHDAIGIMDGPTISRPDGNDTSPLFELSEAFRHCVRLSITPQLYDNVKIQQPVSTVVEPYPMAPRPYFALQEEVLKEKNSLTSEEMMIKNVDCLEGNTTILEVNNTNATKESSSRTNALTKRLAFAINPVNGAKALIWYLAKTPDYVAITPSLASYCVKKAINWKRVREEDSDIDDSGKQKIRPF